LKIKTTRLKLKLKFN